MKEFGEAAKGLTRNPLGVIGLFIVLVYGFACLVLGVGASNLDQSSKERISWFVVIFPVLILGVFFRLVTAHHRKLYAPSDYKDERLFATPLSDEKRTERLESEIKRVQEPEDTPVTQPNRPPTGSVAAPLPPTPPASIRSAYADAERLAFLALEQEIGKPFQKYVQVSAHGRQEEFDGVLITDREAHLIEVKYFSRPAFKRELLEALIHRATSFAWEHITNEKAGKERIVFWIGIVVDFDKSALADFKRKVQDSVRCDLFDVRLRFYVLSELKEKYG